MGFLMEHERYTYAEALRWLAQKYQVEITEDQTTADEDKIEQHIKESLYVINEFAQKFYSDLLFNNEDGKAIGLTYFKERGFSEAAIKKFGLGYSPDMRYLISDAALKQGYQKEYLIKSGISFEQESDGKLSDRFRGRVIFPIHNISGRVIAFGARILKSDAKVAKYINSPETEIYVKSKILYGIHHAKKEISAKDECYLVEGYTDVISLHQAGIENVVASSGTSLTVDQVRLIGRFTKNVTVLYDGDAAGIKASLRGIDLILEQGLNVRIVLFPNGEDPDSYSNKVSSTELKEFLSKESKDFITFKTNLLLEETAGDPVKRAGLVKDVVESISKIPDGLIRTAYIQQCSVMLGMNEQVLMTELNRMRRKASQSRDENAEQQEWIHEQQVAVQPLAEDFSAANFERELLKILFEHDQSEISGADKEESYKVPVPDFILTELEKDDIEFREDVYSNLFNEYKKFRAEDSALIKERLIHHSDTTIRNSVSDLLMQRYQVSDWDRKGIKTPPEYKEVNHAVYSTLYLLKLKKVQLYLKESQDKLKELFSGGGTYDDQLEIHRSLEEIKIEMSRYLGTVVLK